MATRLHPAMIGALVGALATMPEAGTARGTPARGGGARPESKGWSDRASYRRRRRSLPRVMGRGSQAVHRARREQAA